METYIFAGRVLPERAMVSVAPILLQVIAGDDLFDVEVEIALSVVTVRLTSSSLINDLVSLRNHVQHMVGSILDTFGFAAGYGYDVEITAEVAHIPTTVFGIDIAEIGPSSRAEFDRLFQEVFNASMSPKPNARLLQWALRDYRDAIRNADGTLYLSYRAIETLLPAFGDNKPWRAMHAALNTSRAFVGWLVEPAQMRRHGQSIFVTHEQRVAALRTAKSFLERFTAYLGTEQRLDPVAFPTLDDPLWPIG